MVYPFQPWSRDPSSIRSSLSEASSSNQHAYFDLSFSSTYSPMASMPPPPPPPSLNDDLLDINPRKCSFSSNSMNNACAFPSWPNRPSLITADSEVSTASAYLSDEDLFPDGPITPEPAVDEESAAYDPRMGPASLTTEQQIQMLRAAAEEEAQRARFLAQVQAHAKAQQAIRVAQLAASEKESNKRTKKQRKPVVAEKKRRTTSHSKTVAYRA
ncbi:hypothetical protein BJX70DRAFT_394230 [Aspergillus crustosus]